MQTLPIFNLFPRIVRQNMEIYKLYNNLPSSPRFFRACHHAFKERQQIQYKRVLNPSISPFLTFGPLPMAVNEKHVL